MGEEVAAQGRCVIEEDSKSFPLGHCDLHLGLLRRPNRSPQMQWPKVAEMYSPSIPEARSLKSRCQQGHTPFEISIGQCVLVSSSFSGLQGVPGLWWHDSSHTAFSPVSPCVLSYLYKDSPLASGGAHLKILNYIRKDIFPQINSQSQELEVRTRCCLFRGRRSAQYDVFPPPGDLARSLNFSPPFSCLAEGLLRHVAPLGCLGRR